jgi:hypothetical protein
LINNRQNGRRRGRGGQQARNGQPGGSNNNGGSRLDNRARGNAAQLLEKYKTLARDAQMQGDRVATEYYLQFADHYFRVLAETRSRFEEQRPRQQGDFREDYGDEGDGDGANDAQARGYDRRIDGDDGSDNWDDGDQPQREQAPREQAQREQPSREQVQREQPQREQAARDQAPRAQESRPRRDDREPRVERPRRNGNSANGNSTNGNGNGNYAPSEELSAEALPPRIELDRLPPSISEASEVSEAPAAEAPARVRRPRRPRESAPVEA